MTTKELKEKALLFIKGKSFINKKFFSIPIQKIVEFNAKGIKHAINRNYKFPEIELQLIENIPKILTDAHYMGFEKNTKKTDKNVIGVHNYYNLIVFEGNMYEVWLKVKETRDKTYFYDFGIIRKLE